MSKPSVLNLLHNHGSEYGDVLRYLCGSPSLAGTLGDSSVVKAAVVHAVRDEMAQKLGDVAFRRTDLGTAGHPGTAALTECADIMATELGWSQTRKRQACHGQATTPSSRYPSASDAPM